MIKLFLLILLTRQAFCVVQVPEFNLQFRSGWLTTAGNRHIPFEPISGQLIMEAEGIPLEAYAGKIVLKTTINHCDVEIKYYEELGAIGAIILDTKPTIPGNSITRFRNDVNYTIPAVDLTYYDWPVLAELFGNITVASGFTRFINVTLDATDGNEWKEMFYGGGVFSLQIYNGLVLIGLTVFAITIVVKMHKNNLSHLANPLTVLGVILHANIWRLIGLPDFNAWLQISEYRWALFATVAGISSVFAACWLITMLLLEAVTYQNLEVKLFISQSRWPFFLIATVLVSNDWINQIVLTYFSSDPTAITAILTIWLSIILGLCAIIAIIFVIVSASALKLLYRGASIGDDKSKKLKRFRRSMFIYIAIAICLIGYVIVAGTAIAAVNEPYSVLGTCYGYTTLLNIITILLLINVDISISKQIKSRSGGSKTNSNTNETNSQPV